MKRLFVVLVILISLGGCRTETGNELLTTTQVPKSEQSDEIISSTQKAEIEAENQEAGYLDSIIENTTPYSIFDRGADIAEGDVVVMGSFSHGDKDYGGYPQLPVQWIVLEKRESEVLLFSLYGVDTEPYYDMGKTEEEDMPESVSWETSSLRKWLNIDFLQSAFLKTEQDCIKQVAVQTQSNSIYGTGGGETKDYLFLLSEEEAKKFFDTEAKRITHTVPRVEQGYALFGDEPPEDFFDGWWLRTSCKDTERAVYVNQQGQVVSEGAYVESRHIAVRPAMWVDLKKVEQLSETLNLNDFLKREENVALYEDKEAYREILKNLWKLNGMDEVRKENASIEGVGLSLEDVSENRLYDNCSSTLPLSEESLVKLRETGKQWSGCENNGFLQHRVSYVMFKYNGTLHTQFIEFEQYWETPERENQYISRSFTIKRIAGTNQLCEVKWKGYVRDEEEKTELLRQVNYVTQMLGMETEIMPEDDSYYYDGKEFRVSISRNSLLDSNELGKYYYVRIY